MDPWALQDHLSHMWQNSLITWSMINNSTVVDVKMALERDANAFKCLHPYLCLTGLQL